MRIQRLTTVSEALAENIIRSVLAGTKWTVALKLPVQVVVGREADGLSTDEFSLYTRGHFDFVVYRADDHVPKFAVEFDGFGHENARQIARDVIKNRFCAQAGLPLLRIGTTELSERDEISILEWLLDRFVAWEERGHEFVPKLAALGIDPGKDPTRARDALFELFHNENLYPGNWAAILGLYERFGIAPQLEGRENATPSAPYSLEVAWPGEESSESGPTSEYLVLTVRAILRRQGQRNDELLAVTGRARFGWANRINRLARGGPAIEGLQLSVKQWAELGFAPQTQPWLNPSSIASDMATYHVLSQVERWAERNLAGPSRPGTVTTRA